jgi:succinate dehydrogenase / fumarate reductase, cytochrome b subunit
MPAPTETPSGVKESKAATAAGPGTARKAEKRSFVADFYASSIGKKWVMGVTGVIMMGYVLVHMLANFRIYWDQQGLDDYAAWLRVFGAPATPEGVLLWVARIGLLVAFLLHIHAAYGLTRMNWAVRGKYEQKRDYIAADFASRTMRFTGIIVLLFIVYHVLHLTTGHVHPDFEEHHVAHNVIAGFQQLPTVVFYVLANIALAFHLYHGAWSLFRTFGFSNPRFERWTRTFATGFAVAIAVGNISMPVAIFAGIID